MWWVLPLPIFIQQAKIHFFFKFDYYQTCMLISTSYITLRWSSLQNYVRREHLQHPHNNKTFCIIEILGNQITWRRERELTEIYKNLNILKLKTFLKIKTERKSNKKRSVLKSENHGAYPAPLSACIFMAFKIIK